MVEATKVNVYEANLGEFHLIMKLGDSELILEADHLLNARFFKLSITNEHTAKRGAHLFTDIGKLYSALIDAIKQKNPSTTIKIDENGKISCKFDLLIGSVKLEEGNQFEIQLEEEKLSENARIWKMIEKLTKKVLDQEKLIKDHKRSSTDIPIEFDSSSQNAGSFSLINAQRTAVFKGVDVWKPILGKNPFAKGKITSFSVHVDRATDSEILIGICPTSLKNCTTNLFAQNGCICYYLKATGSIFNKGKASHTNSPTGGTNTIIKVTVNLIDNKVSFYFGDALIQTVDLDPSIVQSNDYYPSVEFCRVDDAVSFISCSVENF